MTALDRVGQVQGMTAMNAINVEIVRSLFLPIFFGTTLTSGALAVLALVYRGEPGSTAMLWGGVIYVAGMFLVTIAFNVPLNNALAAADPSSIDGSVLWMRYLRVWTLWNHVRTISCTVATALFIVAIAARWRS